MKEISYAPGYYVTETGEVWSFKDRFRKGRKLKPNSYSGWNTVTLSVNGKPLYRRVYKLVAEAFLERPEGAYLVRHLDGNPLNDHVDNLAWGTQKDNARDRKLHERQTGQVGEKHSRAKLSEDDVREIRKRYNAQERPRIIAKSYPVTESMISQIGRRIRWKHVP